MIIGADLASLIERSSDLLRSGDIDALAYRFREDAVLSAATDDGTVLMQGRAEVIDYLKGVRARFENVSLLDVATDTVLYVLVLRADDQFISVVIEPDLTTLLIRRVILCRSILHLVKRDGSRSA